MAGSTLVVKALEAMRQENADEVRPPPPPPRATLHLIPVLVKIPRFAFKWVEHSTCFFTREC